MIQCFASKSCIVIGFPGLSRQLHAPRALEPSLYASASRCNSFGVMLGLRERICEAASSSPSLSAISAYAVRSDKGTHAGISIGLRPSVIFDSTFSSVSRPAALGAAGRLDIQNEAAQGVHAELDEFRGTRRRPVYRRGDSDKILLGQVEPRGSLVSGQIDNPHREPLNGAGH
jgi:hypothetical protein